MKKIFFTTALFIMCSLFVISAFAQTKVASRRVPKWVCETGYWVIETNKHTPKLNTVYFYNNINELVYKEKVDGVVLKAKKRKIKMDLKKVLDESVFAFNQTKISSENGVLVMNLLKH